jgi:hypothetical protein
MLLRTLRRRTLSQIPATATRTLHTSRGTVCFQCAGKVLMPRTLQPLRGMASAATQPVTATRTAEGVDAGVGGGFQPEYGAGKDRADRGTQVLL